MANCSDPTEERLFNACWKPPYGIVTAGTAGTLWAVMFPALVTLGFTDVVEEMLDWSLTDVKVYFKTKCAARLGCSYPDEEGEAVEETADADADEDLYGTMVDEPTGTLPVADEASPLYEYWNIGYATATTDATSGLVVENNFSLNYGTYIILDADGNIYDAATFKGNVGTRADTAAEAGISSINPNLDASILTNEELSGISSFEIREVLRDNTDDDYFIVSWAYGDTARPEFSLTSTTDGNYYDVQWNGDKKPIKAAYKLATKSGIKGFKEGYENLVISTINSIIGTGTTITDPVFNFKKRKRKKIDSAELTMFKELESGATADTTAATTTTTTTTTTSGY